MCPFASCRLMSRLFTPEIAAFYEKFYAGAALPCAVLRFVHTVPSTPPAALLHPFNFCHKPCPGTRGCGRDCLPCTFLLCAEKGIKLVKGDIVTALEGADGKVLGVTGCRAGGCRGAARHMHPLCRLHE